MDSLPRFNREELNPSHTPEPIHPDAPSPSPAEAAAAVLDALSKDISLDANPLDAALPLVPAYQPLEELPLPAAFVATEPVSEPVSGFDDTIHVTAPEISPDGHIIEMPSSDFEAPPVLDLPEGLNRDWYAESLGDPMDTASLTDAPKPLGPIFADAPALAEPVEFASPATPTFSSLDHLETPPQLDAPMPNPEPLPEWTPAGITTSQFELSSSSTDAPEVPALSVPSTPEPILPPISSSPTIQLPTSKPSGPANMDLVFGQDEPAFTVAARFLETYRQDPSSDSGADALFWAAENYQKAGLPGKARGLYQDFIRQYPNHPRVLSAQQALQWIDVDTPTEDQVIRPTLNNMLADPNLPAMPPSATAANVPQMSSLPPIESPPATRTFVLNAPPAANPEPTPTTPTNTAKPAPPAAPSKPLFVRLNEKLNNLPPKQRQMARILATLFLFLLLIVLIFLSRGFFAPKNGTTFSQGNGLTATTGSNGTATTNGTNASGTTGASGTNTSSATANGTSTSSTTNGLAGPTTAGGASTTGSGSSTSDKKAIFDNPLEITGGADLNLTAGGWGWAFKYLEDKAELEKMATTFRSRGYRSGVIKHESKTGYRLIVGQFETKEKADAAKTKLPYDAPSDAWKVEIK